MDRWRETQSAHLQSAQHSIRQGAPPVSPTHLKLVVTAHNATACTKGGIRQHVDANHYFSYSTLHLYHQLQASKDGVEPQAQGVCENSLRLPAVFTVPITRLCEPKYTKQVFCITFVCQEHALPGILPGI
eukprot:1158263-Pelagomonas_calceolata.AAC.8